MVVLCEYLWVWDCWWSKTRHWKTFVGTGDGHPDSKIHSFNVDHIIVESRLIHCQNWLEIQRYFNVDHSEHFQCIFQYLTSMLITIFSLTISQCWFNHILLSGQCSLFYWHFIDELNSSLQWCWEVPITDVYNQLMLQITVLFNTD